MTTVHNDGAKKFSSENCSMQFPKKDAVKAHSSTHLDITSFTCKDLKSRKKKASNNERPKKRLKSCERKV